MSHDTAWDEKVARGRALVSEINDRKWELGDLANEVCPASQRGVSNGHKLDEFAAEIGINADTLREYRRVATAWPNATRVAFQNWQTHRALAGNPEQFTLITEQVWTYNSLSERLGRLPNPSRVNRATGEIDGDATPEQVHRAIKANPDAARQARKALDEQYDESPKPVGKPQPSAQDDATDLVTEFRKLHIGVDRIVRLVNEGKTVSSDEARDAILREIGWLRTALGYIETGVRSDSLVDEVAAFLQEVS